MKKCIYIFLALLLVACSSGGGHHGSSSGGSSLSGWMTGPIVPVDPGPAPTHRIGPG